MASYGYTFTSGDTLTPTKLNDARTISAIQTADISDAQITAAKLASNAVETAKIADANVTTAKIADSAVTSAKIADGAIVNADINASAAIAHSKLANITAGQVLLGNDSNVPTATALSGDVTVNSSGVTAIGAGVIVDADVNASAAIGLSKLATGALPTGITVASANLVDGTIVNADINNSAAIAGTKLASDSITDTQIKSDAAIAGTKIAPNFGSQNVVTTGALGVGTTNPAGTIEAVGASTATITCRGTTGRGNLVLTTGEADGTDVFAGTVAFQGGPSVSSSAEARIALISAQTEGASANNRGGRIIFNVKPNATASLVEAVRINSAGNVGIGNTNPATRLVVDGTVTATTFSVSGVQVVSSRRTGWGAATGTATRTTFATSTVTTAQLAERVKALIDDLTTHGLIGA